jgi:hypothetical protein
MANDEHIRLLGEGSAIWNEWRERNPDITPDLSRLELPWAYHIELLAGANLSGASLYEAMLADQNLRKAQLAHANLVGADFSCADLRCRANLRYANLRRANLSKAALRAANLSRATLRGASLSGADLSEANLSGADLRNADLTGCRVYGISAWALKTNGAKQLDLIITPEDEPKVSVDNIEVAQFIYLLIQNTKIRDVIDSITSKVVLILGRFTPERKAVLNALRDKLRQRNYLPVVFDFEKPESRTTVETITLLARMALFVIADLSDAKSVLQELQAIVPNLPSVAVQPLILVSQQEPGMFDFFRSYFWVLEPYYYKSQKQLIASLNEQVISRADAMAFELRGTRSTDRWHRNWHRSA